MKVLIKDKDGQVLFESDTVNYCEVIEDEYDYAKIETTTGNMVMNDIKIIKSYRLMNAPAVHEGGK